MFFAGVAHQIERIDDLILHSAFLKCYVLYRTMSLLLSRLVTIGKSCGPKALPCLKFVKKKRKNLANLTIFSSFSLSPPSPWAFFCYLSQSQLNPKLRPWVETKHRIIINYEISPNFASFSGKISRNFALSWEISSIFFPFLDSPLWKTLLYTRINWRPEA